MNAEQAPVQFSNPEEELAYLRQRVAAQEQAMASGQQVTEQITQQAAERVAQEVRQEAAPMQPRPEVVQQVQTIDMSQFGLSPEQDDIFIAQLFEVALQRGVQETFAAIQKMKNPHIDDDFHRFLVQYLIRTARLPGVKPGSELYKEVNVSLFEITLPDGGDDKSTQAGNLLTLMEQFYAGMMSVATSRNNKEGAQYTVEIALSNTSDHIVFYCAVPNGKIDLLEKQILGLYPDARIERIPDDYNVFNHQGAAAGAYGVSSVNDAMTMKTHDALDHDPLPVILNVFSKLDTIGEGAALQLIIRPKGDEVRHRNDQILKGLRDGKSLSKAAREADSMFTGAIKVAKEIIFGVKKDENEQKDIDDQSINSITKKNESTLVETNLRVIASAQNEVRAKRILADMQSAFQQFRDSNGTGIDFKLVGDREAQRFFHKFSYRSFDDDHLLRLNLRELASIYHFPIGVTGSPQLKQAEAKTAPAALDAPTEGLWMGTNKHRNREKEIYMAPGDRVRHFYVIGQTGTGKTYFLRHLIKQDIENGHGCCFIDPHGSDVEDILSYIPKERIDDLIYFDPAYAPRPMGLNMLEYDTRFPEQKTFVVDEMLGIFNKLFDMKTAGGPMFEQYFRNATMLVIEDPSSGNTLLEISRVLADDNFRKMKLERCKNPIVVQFWEEIAGKAGGEASLQNIVPYITSKFDVFLSNEIMRPIVGQAQSAFNFRKIMDERKILVVNLSKGRLGEINANLIGLILVGKILMAAMSRADTPDMKSLPPFYLYIDEFQNVTTNSISQILSEARKYGLGLNIAHQFIKQLQEDIKDAVFGNVGSVGVFRISPDDAEYLERRLAPTFSAQDIMKLTMGNYYLQMLGNGTPMKPFNVKVPEIKGGREEVIQKLKEYSFMKFGRPREEVEKEIMDKYRAMREPATQAPAPPNPFAV